VWRFSVEVVMQLPEDVDSADTDRSVTFGEFYRRELKGQVRRATLILGSDDAANDVVHDAMVEVYRRWDDLASPGAYVNRAVLNGCRDVGRRSSALRRLLPRLRSSDDSRRPADQPVARACRPSADP
jgi:DNA-directed RNA polymerase specialized sigma24 family protein